MEWADLSKAVYALGKLVEMHENELLEERLASIERAMQSPKLRVINGSVMARTADE